MVEFFYREVESESRRMVGPFYSEDEARKAARYKGLRNVEVLRKNGVNYDPITKDAGRDAVGKSA